MSSRNNPEDYYFVRQEPQLPAVRVFVEPSHIRCGRTARVSTLLVQ